MKNAQELNLSDRLQRLRTAYRVGGLLIARGQVSTVAGVVDAPIFLAQVEDPVVVEVAIADQGAELEDGFRPFSFAQMPGCDDEEVTTVESGDFADVEPFGEGDHPGVHHLQAR
jgi:hypothetical protein